MTKSSKSEEIIVLSDEEEDDVQIESVITPKSTTNNSTQAHSRAPLLILTEPKSLTYGIERGYKLKHIHGLKRLSTSNILMYLVEYDLCEDYEFVPSTILRRYCDENLLIDYLQKLSRFVD